MPGSPLFRIRAALTEPRALLGSWKLSVVLMVSACVFYVLLTVYSITAPSHVVAAIARLSVFWLCWVALFVNTFVCVWNRWRSIAWHSVLFHGALFVVATGVVLSMSTRAESKIRVAAGEAFTGADEQYLVRANGAAPPALTMRSLAEEFWRDQLLFTRLEATLDLGGRARVTKINCPLWIGPASFLRLSGFGLAPRYEVLDAQGRVLESAFAKLDVFPPGQRDFVAPQNFPYRVYLEVYPDAELTPRGIVNRTQNLSRPLLLATVFRGHLAIASAPLRLGERLELEGLSLRFPQIERWGELTYVRDPGVPMIFLGFAVGIAGLVMKLCTRV